MSWTSVGIGLLVLVSGLAGFMRGRPWRDQAEGPFIARPPIALRRLLRAGDGPFAVAALPIQVWGLVTMAVGIAIIVGLVPGPSAMLAGRSWLQEGSC